MKRFIIPVVILATGLCAFSAASQKKCKKKFTFSGTIMETHDYCGGAAPSQDQLHPAPVGKPGIKLYVCKGKTNEYSAAIIDSLVSGENGLFTISLPPGEYCLVEAAKKDKPSVPAETNFSVWDSACYMKQYHACDYYVSLKANVTDAKIVFTRHCPWTTPCLNYHGPLPPSAPPRNEKPPHNE